MNIIRSRLARAIVVNYDTSIYHQNKNPDRLRKGTYARGVTQYPTRISFMVSREVNAKLTKMTKEYRIKRSVIMRDAIEFYLGMAEQEADQTPLTNADILSTTLAPNKVRRPDGAVVLITEVEPGTGKEVQSQSQRGKS